jgi:hypothetical protein
VRELDATTSRFDRRASTYQDSALQQFLFGPAQKTALQLALELVRSLSTLVRQVSWEIAVVPPLGRWAC